MFHQQSFGTTHVLAATRCQLGEGPLWDARRQTLFWTDIERGEIFAWGETQKCHSCIYQGEPVGGFTLEESGALVLFRVNDITLYDPDTGRMKKKPFADEGMSRFNDVTADPLGRVFAGSIGKDDSSGGLFRFDPDGSNRLLFRGTGVSNGMGFSLDGHTFYWTCSTTGRIFAFDYDLENGELSGRRVFYACEPAEGVPDGLCVDDHDNVWSARWEGSCIAGHAAGDGRVFAKIQVPAARVTSCCFGGEGNDMMFITTARTPDEQPTSIAGALFGTRAASRGAPVFTSRLFT